MKQVVVARQLEHPLRQSGQISTDPKILQLITAYKKVFSEDLKLSGTELHTSSDLLSGNYRLHRSEIRKIIMKLFNLPSILSKVAILILSSAIAASAADSFSDADKAFVAKVSQGGMYEVELGKLAETKALDQDIKDQGNTEAHDHTLVGDKLKSIVEANGMEFPKQLNAEFLARLDKISALAEPDSLCSACRFGLCGIRA